jgi:hypothetical protein
MQSRHPKKIAGKKIRQSNREAMRPRPPFVSTGRITASIVALQSFLFGLTGQASDKRSQTSHVLNGEVSSVSLLDELNSALGFTVVHTNPKSIAGRVSSVHMGTAAFYQGLAVDDIVSDEQTDGTQLIVTIQRDGKKYQLRLSHNYLKGKLGAQVAPPLAGGGATAPGKQLWELNLNAVEKFSPAERNRILSAREIVILIDKSGSMAERDCPGGLSRWQWCEKQIDTLSNQLSNVLKGLTLVVFDENYRTYKNVGLTDVQRVFKSNQPLGGTHTAEALDAQLKDYFEHNQSKPLSIAVLTDGLPNDPELLKKVIIDASKRINYPGEVLITFLEAGPTREGTWLLEELDNELVTQGATQDIVDMKGFWELNKIGLRDAIVSAVYEAAPDSVAKAMKEPGMAKQRAKH